MGLSDEQFVRLGYKRQPYGWQWDKDAEVNQVTIMFEGLVLRNVHPWEDCQRRWGFDSSNEVCVIHRPTPHHMRLWPLNWRDDRGIFERQCEHGIGHPDPDQFPYWESVDKMAEAIHGCDGCCHVARA